MNMTPQHYKLFAELFESFLSEASTAIDMIGSLPGGKAVVQKLHNDMGLAHDQQFSQVEKIAWSQLKDMYKGGWVLVKGSKGGGAIRAKGGGYESIAVNTSGEVEVFKNDRGGNNIDFLKANIGKLVGFYVGRDTGAVSDLKSKRSKNKQGVGPQQTTREVLVKKFKPLWLRSIQAAEADVKGMIATMIKNGAYEKAERKLGILKNLQRAGDSLEMGTLDEAPSWLQSSVQSAILMAASHYYPEETGEIQRSRYGGRELNATNDQGPRKLLQDITDGDTKKLGTVLGFFKRNLITS